MAGMPDPETLPAYQRERRQAIVDAARELLDEKDFDQVQVRDVAAKAGVALGTLYRYFSSKDHLFVVMFAQWGTPVLDPNWLSHLSPADRFRARLHATFRALERHPSFLKLVLLMGTSEDPEAIKVTDIFSHYLGRVFEADLASLPGKEADHITEMVWALHSSLVGQLVQGRLEAAGVLAVIDSFCDLVQLRLETAELAVRATP